MPILKDGELNCSPSRCVEEADQLVMREILRGLELLVPPRAPILLRREVCSYLGRSRQRGLWLPYRSPDVFACWPL